MATLFNTKIKDTYQSLLKLEDNTILTTTVKNVTDGLGNASPLYMSTTRIGIGTNAPTTTLDVNGSARINGALTLPNNNTTFLTVGTFTWFADNNNILRLTSGGFNRLNLGTNGTLTTVAYYGEQIGSNTNPEAYSYSIAGNIQVDGVNRNLSSVNKNIFIAQTTGVGSVQNAPILRYFYAVKGGVTGFTSYRGIEIENLDSYFGTTSGNVMIGTTTNAGYKLDVNGTARVTGAVTGGDGSNFNGIYFYGGGDRKIKPGVNQLDITDSAGTSGFQVGGGGGFPRVALGYDKFDFVKGLGNFTYSAPGSQSLTLNLNGQGSNHQTPFADIVAQGYAPSAPSGNNTTLRLYTTNTTSGTYGNIIIGHNGTNATGNVGIGTSSPTERLDVVGNIKGSSNLVLGDTPGGSGGGFQLIRNNNIYSSALVHSQSKYLYLFANPQGYTAGGFPAASTGIYSLGPILFMPDGTTSVSMLTNGNVLIGTTTDSGHKLRVNGSISASSVDLSQGTIGAGQLDLLYPNNIRYQSAYYFTIAPKDNSGNTLSSGGNIFLNGDSVNFLHGSSLGLSFATITNAGDTIKIKRALGPGHIPLYLAIEGSDASAYNYGTKSGSILIYPGEQSNGNGYGNVVLGHSGTAARGNVLIGTFTDAGYKLDVNGTTRVTNLRSGNFYAASPLDVGISGTGYMATFQYGAVAGGGSLFFVRAGAAAGSITSSRYEAYDLVLGAGNYGSTLGIAIRPASIGGVKIGGDSTTVTHIDSAILNVESTTKGFLPPRMTNAERAAITSPAIGLMVYCTDSVEGLYVYKSTGWTFIA